MLRKIRFFFSNFYMNDLFDLKNKELIERIGMIRKDKLQLNQKTFNFLQQRITYLNDDNFDTLAQLFSDLNYLKFESTLIVEQISKQYQQNLTSLNAIQIISAICNNQDQVTEQQFQLYQNIFEQIEKLDFDLDQISQIYKSIRTLKLESVHFQEFFNKIENQLQEKNLNDQQIVRVYNMIKDRNIDFSKFDQELLLQLFTQQADINHDMLKNLQVENLKKKLLINLVRYSYRFEKSEFTFLAQKINHNIEFDFEIFQFLAYHEINLDEFIINCRIMRFDFYIFLNYYNSINENRHQLQEEKIKTKMDQRVYFDKNQQVLQRCISQTELFISIQERILIKEKKFDVIPQLYNNTLIQTHLQIMLQQSQISLNHIVKKYNQNIYDYQLIWFYLNEEKSIKNFIFLKKNNGFIKYVIKNNFQDQFIQILVQVENHHLKQSIIQFYQQVFK